MEEYLRHTKDALDDLTRFTKVYGILGNESCDLDSTVSAVVFGYYLHTLSQDETTVFLPILNISRGELRLRTETTYFLSKVKLSVDLLTFRDEVNLAGLHKEGRLVLSLVDHNVLPLKDAILEDVVTMVIDHHFRERPESDSVTVILDTVASCCTLVAELLLRNPNFNLDQQVAILLFGTILVDTINRSPEAGKTTPRDEAILSRLKEKLPSLDGQGLFDELHMAKFELSNLSNLELLEKDLKMIGNNNMTIAMSSITIHLQDLLERPGFEEDVAEFCFSKGANVVVIMTLSMKTGVERQLAVYSENRIFRQQIADLLDVSGSPSLELDPIASSIDSILSFMQGNVQASRKKVLPILKTFLNGEATPRLDQQISPFDGLDSETLGSDAPLVSIKDSVSQEESEDFAENNLQELVETGFEPVDLGYDNAEFVPQAVVETSIEPVRAGFDNTEFVPQELVQSNQEPVATGFGDADTDPFGLFSSSSANPTVGSGSGDPVTTSLNIFMDDLDPFSALSSGLGVDQSHNNSANQTCNNHSGNPFGAFDPFGFSGSAGEISKPSANANSENCSSNMDAFNDNFLDLDKTDNPTAFKSTHLDFTQDGANSNVNSSEMVQEKMTSLNYGDESPPEDPDTASGLPFVPHSSFQDSQFDAFAQQFDLPSSHDLPSFNSAEMVQRIHEKRSSLGAENFHSLEHAGEQRVGDEQSFLSPLEADTFPYTPQNSLVDNNMEKYKSQLVGLDDTNLESKVGEKRNSLEFVDSSAFDVSGILDLSVNEQEVSTKTTGNVVAFSLAHEMKDNFGIDFGGIPEDAIEPEYVAHAIAEDNMEVSISDGQSPDEVLENTSPDYTDIFVGRVEREPSVENFQEFLPEVERNVITHHITSEMKAEATSPNYSSSQGMFSAADPFGFGDFGEDSERNLFQRDMEGMAEEIIQQNLEEVSRKGSDQMSGPLFLGKHPSKTDCLNGEPAESLVENDGKDIENVVAERIVSDMFSNLSRMQENQEDKEENGICEEVVLSGIDNPAFDTSELSRDDLSVVDNVVAARIAREMRSEQGQSDGSFWVDPESLAKEIVANTYDRVAKETEQNLWLTEANNVTENSRHAFDDDMDGENREESSSTRNIVAEQVAEKMAVEGNTENEGDNNPVRNVVAQQIAEEMAVGEEIGNCEKKEDDNSIRNIVAEQTAEEMAVGVQFQNDVDEQDTGISQMNGLGNGSNSDESDENSVDSDGDADAAILVAQKFTDDIITEACEIIAKDGPWPPGGGASRNMSRSDLARRMMEAEELLSDEDSGKDDSDKDDEKNDSPEDQGSFDRNDDEIEVDQDSGLHAAGTNGVMDPMPKEEHAEEDNLIAQRIAEAMQESGENFGQFEKSDDPSVSQKKTRFVDDTLLGDEGMNSKSSKKARFVDEISEEHSSTTEAVVIGDSPINAESLDQDDSSEEDLEHLLPGESRNAVASRIAKEMLAVSNSLPRPLEGLGFDDGVECNENEIDEGIGTEVLSPDRQDVVREVAFDLAKEIIEKALETFPVDQLPLEDGLSESESVSSVDVSPNSGNYPHPQMSEIGSDLRRSHEMCPVTAEGQELELELETEYLPNVDPLHGNLDSPSKTWETDASKVIAEDMGFKQLRAEIADRDDSSSGASPIEELTSDKTSGAELEHKNVDILHSDISSRDEFELLSEQRGVIHQDFTDRASLTDGIKAPNRIVVESSDSSEIDNTILASSEVDINSSKSGDSQNVAEGARNIDTSSLAYSGEIEAKAEIHRTESPDNLTNVSSAIPVQGKVLGGGELSSASEESSHFEQFTEPPSGNGSESGQTTLTQRERKEVYMTTAGRISISMESTMEGDAVMTGLGQQGALAGDTITEESHEQVGHILARVESVIDHVDAKLARMPSVLLSSDQTTGAITAVEEIIETRKPDLTDEEFLSKRQGPSTASVGEDQSRNMEQWQEDDYSQMIGQGSAVVAKETDLTVRRDSDSSDTISRPARPGTLPPMLVHPKRKIHVLPNIDLLLNEDLDDDGDDLSLSSSDPDLAGVNDLETPDDISTPEALEKITVPVDYLEWENDSPSPVVSPAAEAIPEYSADKEMCDEKNWRTVTIADQDHTIDMKVVEPYKRVLSHGGYYGDGLNAIIVFSGCYLPDRSRKDYQYVMENLFFYVISTLDLLVAEDYMIVYFHGATPKRQMPSFGWLKRCYQMIDRRLKKNLKGLLLVHPTLWIKTVILMSRPFISSKFTSKLKMVKNLSELEMLVPMQHVFVPDQVRMIDKIAKENPEILEKGFDDQEPGEVEEKPKKKETKKKNKRRFWKKSK